MRLTILLFIAAMLPATGLAADLSAEEILTRMRLQAGERQVVAGTQQGLPPQSAVREDAGRPKTPSDGAGRPGDAAEINLQVLFQFDSERLAPAAISQLRELCAAFRQTSDIDRPFMVVGHTDAVGSEVYNWRLSTARAQEVRRYLVEECGIDVTRLRAEGRGEEELRAGLNPRDSLQRRVEIEIVR